MCYSIVIFSWDVNGLNLIGSYILFELNFHTFNFSSWPDFFFLKYLPNKYLLKAFAKIQYYRMSFQFVAWSEFFIFFFSKENCFLQTLKELYVHFPLSIINLFWRNIWQFCVQKFKISESIQCELTSLWNDKKWSNLNISLF